MPLSTAIEFRENLKHFSDFYEQLEPLNLDNMLEDGHLKSEVMFKDTRRYYLDLKENRRGRFLRVSQTINRGSLRFHIAVPAQGLVEFRNNLSQLLEEYCADSLEATVFKELPDSRTIRVDNKTFYFDVKQNQRGVFMRISEVKVNFRTAITIPEKTWCRFHDVISDFCGRLKEQREQSTQSPDVGDQDDVGVSVGDGDHRHDHDHDDDSDEDDDVRTPRPEQPRTRARITTRGRENVLVIFVYLNI